MSSVTLLFLETSPTQNDNFLLGGNLVFRIFRITGIHLDDTFFTLIMNFLFSYHFPMCLTVLILLILTHAGRLHFTVVLVVLVCLICKKTTINNNDVYLQILEIIARMKSFLSITITNTYFMSMSKKR